MHLFRILRLVSVVRLSTWMAAGLCTAVGMADSTPAFETNVGDSRYLLDGPGDFRKFERGGETQAAMEKLLGPDTLLGYWQDPAVPERTAVIWIDAAETQIFRHRADLVAEAAALGPTELLGRKVLGQKLLKSLDAAQRAFLLQTDLAAVTDKAAGGMAITGKLLLKARILRFALLTPGGNEAVVQSAAAEVATWLERLRQLNPSTVEELVHENEATPESLWNYRWSFVIAGIIIAAVAYHMRQQRNQELLPPL
jgi:hypothetical protein